MKKVLWLIVVVFNVSLAAWLVTPPQTTPRTRVVASSLSMQQRRHDHFVRYIPSRWEKDWHTWVSTHHAYPDNPCDRLREQRIQVDQFLQPFLAQPSIFTSDTQHEDPILSKMVYRDANGTLYAKFIEPLVGVLRHPLLCWDLNKYIVDKDFLILNQAEYRPHQRLYFDLGASTWLTGAGGPSQSWFWHQYQQRNLAFTSMLLWEATPVNHRDLLREVPRAIWPIYQYFNVPVEKEDGQWNAFRVLRDKTQFLDDYFLVLKLDIDHPVVERQLVHEILNNSDLADRIDEFFFEHHTYTQPMAASWQTRAGDGDLLDSYQLFTALRTRGIRAHSWV